MRLNFISYSFEIFRFHYLTISRFTCNSLGILLNDLIILKKILNNIAGIAITIQFYSDDLAISNLDTHLIIFLFAHMQFLTNNNHTFENTICIAS